MTEDTEDFSDILGEGIDASWEDLKETRERSKEDERQYGRLDG
jgi:hypothetical protein